MSESVPAKKILTLEMELKILEAQLRDLVSKNKKKKKDNKFSKLYGIWKKYGDFSYHEIKESEIKLPKDLGI
ncbi:MAG: hypothetical protein ABIL39_11790 [candidate division WOR-3 bacterium]